MTFPVHRRVLVSAVALAAFVLSCSQFNLDIPDAAPAPTASLDATGGAAFDAPSGQMGGAPPPGNAGGAPGGGGTPTGGQSSPCLAGATRCAGSGPTVEVCTVQGTWVMKEACTSVCQNGACSGTCRAGEKHCAANQTPETCSDQGDWVAGDACPNSCTGAGVCGGDCKPSSKRCDVANPLTPQTCDENGKWISGPPCSNLCSSGSCGGSCMPGIRRCGANQTPETCSPKGTWEPDPSPCQFVCSGAGECAGACKPSAKQCAGLTPQVCDTNGSWKDAAGPCARGCAAGACCGNNTEAAGDRCTACGAQGQPCCTIAQPDCSGSQLTCSNGKCVVPCGDGPGQSCCDGHQIACPADNCGKVANRTCKNGRYSDCPASNIDTECCDHPNATSCTPAGQQDVCQNGRHSTKSCGAFGCDPAVGKCRECNDSDPPKCADKMGLGFKTLVQCVNGKISKTPCSGNCFDDSQGGGPRCGCKLERCVCVNAGAPDNGLSTSCDKFGKPFAIACIVPVNGCFVGDHLCRVQDPDPECDF
jgi:hypothetical protein